MRLAGGERERCGVGCRRHGGTLRIRGPECPGQRRRGHAPAANAAAANAPAANAAAAIPAVNPAGRPGVAGANAVDAAGNPFNFNQTAAEALASMNCTVAVPANPLSAQGLATPWQLGDGCTWANGGTEGVFVDATILSPTGQLTVYDPLVINQGTDAGRGADAADDRGGLAGHPQPRVQRQRAGAGGHGRERRATASTPSATR